VGYGAPTRSPDLPIAELQPLIDKVWRHCEDKDARGRTVTLKVKFNDFEIIFPNRFGFWGSLYPRYRATNRQSRNSACQSEAIEAGYRGRQLWLSD
jgi:nucleotidyltransferase/DNA polymerase involved in DNA repair